MGEALRGDDVGKIRALYRALQEHSGYIEADLQRFHGLRLAQVGTKELTWRHLTELIEHLPPESATRQKLAGDDGGWTLTNQLLAAIVDGIAVEIWQHGGDPKAPRPKPIKRPGVVDPGEKKFGSGKHTTADIDRILAGSRDDG